MKLIAVLVIAAAAVQAAGEDTEPVVLPEGMIVAANDATQLEEMLLPDPTEAVHDPTITEDPLVAFERRNVADDLSNKLKDFVHQRFGHQHHDPAATKSAGKRALQDYIQNQRRKHSELANPPEPTDESHLDKRDLERRELDRQIDEFMQKRWGMEPDMLDHLEANVLKMDEQDAPKAPEAGNLVRRVEDFLLRRLGMSHDEKATEANSEAENIVTESVEASKDPRPEQDADLAPGSEEHSKLFRRWDLPPVCKNKARIQLSCPKGYPYPSTLCSGKQMTAERCVARCDNDLSVKYGLASGGILCAGFFGDKGEFEQGCNTIDIESACYACKWKCPEQASLPGYVNTPGNFSSEAVK
ncbi:uncharacterized protein AB675_7564 [Cyphellophora attinorum]|uniref:Kazal-like domain-containing protein n=1 Tax=Cyphellophora attinorum TaxID=1664694 RepID=A0A0N1P175_9EURO|nr:uncharacterized protein AB675_7564 [Phialophora attinorum]KPI40265.1 hypothetical protein AB675_7564 [Phialophora attinorum]